MSAFLQMRLEKRRPMPRIAVMANWMLRVPEIGDVINESYIITNYRQCLCSEHEEYVGTCPVKQEPSSETFDLKLFNFKFHHH